MTTPSDDLEDERLYRAQFEEEVGFDRSTCSRWITDGVLKLGALQRGQPAAMPKSSPTSGTDSSAQADAHRPAAEAQAATGQASAAPLSSAAATASPAAAPETPADLAPDAAPARKAPARRATPGGTLYRADFNTGPVPGETHEEKIERLKRVVAAAKERAGK